MENLKARDYATGKPLVVGEGECFRDVCDRLAGSCCLVVNRADGGRGNRLGVLSVKQAELEPDTPFGAVVTRHRIPEIPADSLLADAVSKLPWCEAPFVAVIDDDGVLVGIMDFLQVLKGMFFAEIKQGPGVDRAASLSAREQEQILDAIPDLIFRLDRECRFVGWFGHHEEEMFLAPREFLGKQIREVLPPDVAVPAETKIRSVFENGDMEMMVYSLQMPPGEEHFEARIVLCSDQEVLVLVRDVTACVRAEKQTDVLQGLISDLNSETTLNGAARVLAHAASQLFRHDAFFFDLHLDPDHGLESLYHEDIPAGGDAPVEFPPARTPGVRLQSPELLSGKPKLINRSGEAEVPAFAPFGDTERLSQSLMFSPIVHDGRIYAVVSAQSYTPSRYNEADLKVFHALVGETAAAVARILSEEEAGKSEAKYRRFVEMANDGIWVIDDKARTSYVNRRMAEMLGYAAPEMAGRSLFDFMDGPAAKEAARYFERRKEGVAERHDFRFRRKDGADLWAIVSACPLNDDAGGFTGALALVTDVTERKAMEDDLRTSRDRLEKLQLKYQAILRSAGFGVCLLGPDWSIQFVNPAVCRIISPDPNMTQDMVGVPLTVLFETAEQFEAFARRVRHDIRAQGSFVDEVEMRRWDRSPLWCEVSVVRLDPAQTASGYVATFNEVTSRRKAQQQLAAAEERYRCLVEQSLVGIYIVQDKRFVYVNPKMAEIFGYTQEEMLALPDTVESIFAPDDHAMVREQRRRRISGEVRSVRYSGRGVRKDGGHIWVSVHGSTLDFGGRVSLIGAVLDISETMRAEIERDCLSRFGAQLAAVRTLEDLAKITSSICAELFEWDAFSFGRRLGNSAEFLPILAMDTINGEKKAFERRVGHGTGYLSQTVLWRGEPLLINRAQETSEPAFELWGDASRRSESLMFAPVMTSGNVVGFVSVQSYTPTKYNGRDRDLLKRIADIAGPALSRCLAEMENARLVAALEQASEAVVITDTEWMIQHVNRAFEQITGFLREEALGQDARRLPEPGDGDPDALRWMVEAMERGESWQGHVRTLRKDGAPLDEILTVSPIRDSGSRIINHLILRRDVTRESAMEEELRQSQKMEAIGMLAGGVAHDFNNLLQVMMGWSEVLLKRMSDADTNRQELETILRAARRGAALTRQLLAFSRKQVLQPQVVNLNQIVESTGKLLRRLIGEDIDLELVLEPGLGRVFADGGQIEQVVLNLAVNSRDAMPQGGRLTIQTENYELLEPETPTISGQLGMPPGRYAMLAVIDSGCGMDSRTLSRIFEPFFTTKEVGKGTGLGLATVYGIVKQSGGYIKVKSTVERGTVFQVFLPRIGDVASADEGELFGPDPMGGTETILVVEDEKPVRDLTTRILASHGYAVLEAKNGRDALLLAANHTGRIDLLLTDLVMPEMGGEQLAEQLLLMYPDVKVLFISGYTMRPPPVNATVKQGVGYLQKPVAPETLLYRVREALESPEG